MVRRPLTPLPPLDLDRMLGRIAEALQVAQDRRRLASFPLWTQRVMRILGAQFVPPQFAAVWSATQAFADGVGVALVARSQHLNGNAPPVGAPLARELARRMKLQPQSAAVAVNVASGAAQLAGEWQPQIMRRLFAADPAEQRAFIEGLAVGHRIPELLANHARHGVTDATPIYLTLWLYWPEINALKTIGEVATVLRPHCAPTTNLAGADWRERIRKIANRLGLSFRAAEPRAGGLPIARKRKARRAPSAA